MINIVGIVILVSITGVLPIGFIGVLFYLRQRTIKCPVCNAELSFKHHPIRAMFSSIPCYICKQQINIFGKKVFK